MKLILYLIFGSFSKTVKVKERNEIKCDLNELELPRNAKGWICDSVPNAVETSTKCKLECDEHFKLEQGNVYKIL